MGRLHDVQANPDGRGGARDLAAEAVWGLRPARVAGDMTRKPIATRTELIEGKPITVKVMAPAGREKDEEQFMECRDDSNSSGQKFMRSERMRMSL